MHSFSVGDYVESIKTSHKKFRGHILKIWSDDLIKVEFDEVQGMHSFAVLYAHQLQSIAKPVAPAPAAIEVEAPLPLYAPEIAPFPLINTGDML